MDDRLGYVVAPVGRVGKPHVKSQFCKQICKPDAAGRLETSDTRRAKGHLTPPVHRGQRGDRRLRQTAETRVAWLITQRQLALSRRAGRWSERGAAVSRKPASGALR